MLGDPGDESLRVIQTVAEPLRWRSLPGYTALRSASKVGEIEAQLGKAQDMGVQIFTLKAILKHIVADEERHHKILKEEIWEM